MKHFRIRHPGTSATICCLDFKEAMMWFEGLNVPVLIDATGQPEPMALACARVRASFQPATKYPPPSSAHWAPLTMQKGFKVFLVIFGVMIVIATISEIRNPAVFDGFGVQWPVFVFVWLGYAAMWVWGTHKGRPGQ